MTRQQIIDDYGSVYGAAADAMTDADAGVPVVCGPRCTRLHGQYGCDCEVEPDGRCPHGCPSVLVALGVI